MKIIINQYFGLGDIIFCMTIARRWIKEGHEIHWPVLGRFVHGLRRAYPNVNWHPKDCLPWRNVDYENKNEHDVTLYGKEYRVIPLRWNVEIMNVPYSRCMETKYTMFGWGYRDWKEGAMWNRDGQKEHELFDKVVKNAPYVLVNENFQSDLKGKKRIIPETDKDIVYMQEIEGYSLFDWYYTILHADAIYTVSTSLLYILEIMDFPLHDIHLYERPTDPGFKQVSYLFTKPYILHT